MINIGHMHFHNFLFQFFLNILYIDYYHKKAKNGLTKQQITQKQMKWKENISNSINKYTSNIDDINKIIITYLPLPIYNNYKLNMCL